MFGAQYVDILAILNLYVVCGYKKPMTRRENMHTKAWAPNKQ